MIEKVDAAKKSIYFTNVALIVVNHWLDLITTQGMIKVHGLHVEANEIAKHYFLNNPEFLSLLKVLVIPAIIAVLSYLIYKKYPRIREAYITGMRIANVCLVCVVFTNAFVITYRG